MISGCLGPRGDGYVPDEVPTIAEAAAFHAPQILAFRDAGADLVVVNTCTVTSAAAADSRKTIRRIARSLAQAAPSAACRISTRVFSGKIAVKGQEQSVSGRGNGLISSVVSTLEDSFGLDLKVLDYTEHALGSGRDARAADRLYIDYRLDADREAELHGCLVIRGGQRLQQRHPAV